MERHGFHSSEHRRTVAWLLKKYEAEIWCILNEVASFQKEIRLVRAQAANVVAVNQDLLRRLKHQVEQRLSTNQPESCNIRNDLEEQLESAIKAKDDTLKLYQEAVNEIENLEQQLEAKQGAIDVDTFEEGVLELRSEYTKALEEITNELERTRNDLHKAQDELRRASTKAFIQHSSVGHAECQLQEKQKTLDAMLQNLQTAQERLLQLEESQLALRTKLDHSTSEVSDLKSKCEAQSKELEDSSNKNKLLEERLTEALEHADASIRAAEQAVLEKQQAVLKQAQVEQEAEELQASLACVVEEAAQRTKNEIDKVQAKKDSCIKDLAQQIEHLQSTLCEKECALDRLSQEKNNLDKEIEKLSSDNAMLRDKMEPVYKTLSQSLVEAERDRDKYKFQFEAQKAQLAELQNRYMVEMKSKEREVEHLETSLREMDMKADALIASQIELQRSSAEHKQRAQMLEAELVTQRKQLQEQVTLLEETMNQREAENIGRLQRTKDECEKRLLDLQALWDAQMKTTEKWKSEAAKLSMDLDTECRRTHAKTDSLKRTNAELNRKLDKEKKKRATYRKELQKVVAGILPPSAPL
ncbi:paramyosin-like isoform X1 [Ornithodoros turicata]|uniref:paramyosin-like isoform X1 n=1 Tax=Ornithodoros turicata TaxID=34597 RepID=UPI0031396EB4